MKRALYVLSSAGLAYALSASAAGGVGALLLSHGSSSLDEVMRWYSVVILTALAGVAFAAALILTPRRSSPRD